MPRKILNICRRCLCRIIKCSTVVHSNISKCSVYFIVDKNVKNGNKILNLKFESLPKKTKGDFCRVKSMYSSKDMKKTDLKKEKKIKFCISNSEFLNDRFIDRVQPKKI
jgi:hypothetical protein